MAILAGKSLNLLGSARIRLAFNRKLVYNLIIPPRSVARGRDLYAPPRLGGELLGNFIATALANPYCQLVSEFHELAPLDDH
jgi:hypothetical protein